MTTKWRRWGHRYIRTLTSKREKALIAAQRGWRKKGAGKLILVFRGFMERIKG